jgi:nitroimidazol reductase NimA-like FMN-containing flavoprotein (pyridoxamine 5'-phosphate oxidase superfamily)
MPKEWITDRAEMETILRECPVGSLATVGPDGAPYVVTVNYVYHNGKITFHGALKGKKMDNLAHEPRVCFEVHVVDCIIRAPRAMEFGTRYRSVIVHGRARQLADPAAKMEALMALTARYADGYPFEPPTDRDVGATAVIEIEVDEMTGKKNVDPSTRVEEKKL